MATEPTKSIVRACLMKHKIPKDHLEAIMDKPLDELMANPDVYNLVKGKIKEIDYTEKTTIDDTTKYEQAQANIESHSDGTVVGQHSFISFDPTGRQKTAALETNIQTEKHHWNMLMQPMLQRVGKEWHWKREKGEAEGGGTAYASGMVQTGGEEGLDININPRPEYDIKEIEGVAYYLVNEEPPPELESDFGKDAGTTFREIYDKQREERNAHGGDRGIFIKHIPKWIPLQLNHTKAMNTSREEFINKVFDWLDVESVRKNMGEKASVRRGVQRLAAEAAGVPHAEMPKAMKREDFTDDMIKDEIGKTWDAVETGGMSRVDESKLTIKSMKNREAEKRRDMDKIWIWKDAPAMIAYQKEFGTGTLMDAMLTNIDVEAQHIAAQRQLGSDPKSTLKLLTQWSEARLINTAKKIAKDPNWSKHPLLEAIGPVRNKMTFSPVVKRVSLRDAVNAYRSGDGKRINKLHERINKQLERSEDELERLSPTYDAHIRRTAAEWNASIRNVVQGIKIPIVTPIDVLAVDPANSYFTATMNGVPRTEAAKSVLTAWLRTFTPKKMDLLTRDHLNRAYIETNYHRADIIRQTSIMLEGGHQSTQRFANATIRASGVPKGSHMQLMEHQLKYQGVLTDNSARYDWNQLKEKEPVLWERLLSYGMRADGWEALRKAPRMDKGEAGMRAPYIDFLNMGGNPSQIQARNASIAWWQTESEKMGLSMPGVRGHRAMMGRGKPGDMEYEARAHGLMFRKYPWEWVGNRYLRSVGASAASGKHRMQLAVEGTIALGVMTAIGETLKEVAKGREPPAWNNPAFMWSVMMNSAQIFRGMGISPVEERSFQDLIRALGGPMYSEAYDSYNLLFAPNNSGIISSLWGIGLEGEEINWAKVAYNAEGYFGKRVQGLIPGLNDWYLTKLTVERAFVMSMQENTDSKTFYQKMRGREKYRQEEGVAGGFQNDTWWDEDSAMPF